MHDETRMLTVENLLRRLRDRLWLCAFVAFLFIAGGIAIAFFSTKVYRAEAVLAPNRDVASEAGVGSMLGSLGGLASLSGMLDSGQSITNEAIATLRSRAFLQKFIEDQNLLPHLYKKYWDKEKGKWNPDVEIEPTAARSWKHFRDDLLRIEQARNSELYTVSIEFEDTKLPAVWLTALIDRLNTEMRTRQMKESKDVLQFLASQVEKTDTVEVRAALFKLAEAQLRRGAMANVRQDYAFRVIDPPFSSEEDQFVRPRRVILLALSIILGFAAALVVAIVAPPKRAKA